MRKHDYTDLTKTRSKSATTHICARCGYASKLSNCPLCGHTIRGGG